MCVSSFAGCSLILKEFAVFLHHQLLTAARKVPQHQQFACRSGLDVDSLAGNELVHGLDIPYISQKTCRFVIVDAETGKQASRAYRPARFVPAARMSCRDQRLEKSQELRGGGQPAPREVLRTTCPARYRTPPPCRTRECSITESTSAACFSSRSVAFSAKP